MGHKSENVGINMYNNLFVRNYFIISYEGQKGVCIVRITMYNTDMYIADLLHRAVQLRQMTRSRKQKLFKMGPASTLS